MNSMEMKQCSAAYTAPSVEFYDVVAEGVLCQSVGNNVSTEEWDIVDLSKM